VISARDLSTLKAGFALLTASLPSADLLEPGRWVSFFSPGRNSRGEENKGIVFLREEFTKATFHEKVLKNVLLLVAVFLQNPRILLNLPINECPCSLPFLQHLFARRGQD